MRSDMGRVVIERPRSGSSNPSLKARVVGKVISDQTGEYDFDGPLRIPSSGNGMRKYSQKIGDKNFSDVLGPLDGYLRSSVGRKWDDVFSELSRHLGAFSWPLQHIMRFHIDVETNTYLGVDGKVYAENKYGNTCVSDFTSGWRRGEYYVDPLTRRLCVAPPRTRERGPREPLPQRVTDRIQLEGDRWMVRVNGNWFIGTYRHARFESAVARPGRAWYRNSWEPTDLVWPNFRIAHGNDWGSYLFTRIKSANQREIRSAYARKEGSHGGHKSEHKSGHNIQRRRNGVSGVDRVP